MLFRSRVPLLGVNEVGEFGGIANEEDGSVVEHPIPVTLIGPQLNGKATGVASSIGRTRFASDSRETDSGANPLTDRAQKRLRGDVAQIVSDLEVSMGTSTLGVDLHDGSDHKIGEGSDQSDLRHAQEYVHGQSERGDRCGGSL